MPERFLIWGAGGHGRVVCDMLLACGDTVVGFVDRAPQGPDILTCSGERVPLLADGDLAGNVSLPFGATAVALAVGDNGARLARFEEWSRRWPCPLRVHPTAIIGRGVTIGEGTMVLPGVVINTGARIGRAVIVNTGVVVEHDCVLDDGSHASPGSVLCGGVSVGRRSWVGAGATVIPVRRIGADVVVGAGSTVISDVGDGETVVGSPARPIRRRSPS